MEPSKSHKQMTSAEDKYLTGTTGLSMIKPDSY
jgi:hypothetical protein